MRKNVESGLDWLTAHQHADGRWSAAEFMDHDPLEDKTDGAGDRSHDVGVTGLALLAYMGDGVTHLAGKDRGAVARGLEWLRGQQDAETGLYGDVASWSFLYDHAIASLAMTEAYLLSGDESLRAPAQSGVHFILRARNPYGVWRYDSPPNGENDTSMTAWMIQALRSAADAGLSVDREAWAAATEWVDSMTDPATGRVGYTERGSRSSRVPGKNVAYSSEVYETLTAAGLYIMFLSAGERPTQELAGGGPDTGLPMQQRRADLLLRSAASLRDPSIPRDLYAVYFGSRAMYQVGGAHWERWSEALRTAVHDGQRRDGAAVGSYDPDGPWGYSGGRVDSTAMMVLSAQLLERDDALRK